MFCERVYTRNDRILLFAADDNTVKIESNVKYEDKDLEEIVEGALKQMDVNNDGYIDYTEFRKASVV